MADMTLLDSFPFDSNPDLVYDDDGYPRYDRAVGATILRSTFEKFFTDGVFPSPAGAMQINKGDGLAVTVNPGIFIIKGAMGGAMAGSDPWSLTLDTAAPQGNTCYAIMVRFDNNETTRSLYLRVVKGEAASTPTPPEPDQTSANVFEYRLGYVTVPNGATDLTSATVTNEVGLSTCPYAAPFEDIDLSEVVHDAQVQASESLNAFLAFLQQNWDLVNSAIDGTTAGNLQSQINELENNALTTENIDNSTIVFEPTTTSGGANRLQVNDLSIGTEHLKDKSVTQAKLGDDVASYIQNVVKPQPGKDIGAYSWQELIEMANDTDIELSDLDYLIGQSRNISITGYGTFAFQLIGIGHDSLASGGTSKLLTFQSIDIVCNHNMNSSNTTSGGWASSAMRTFMNGDLLSKFPQYVQDVIVEVKKPYCATANGATQYSNDKLFIASEKEIFGTSSYGNDGTQYEYWSINNTNNARIKKLNGSAQYWWMRSVRDSTTFRNVYTDGSASSNGASYSGGCVPCFCIGQS